MESINLFYLRGSKSGEHSVLLYFLLYNRAIRMAGILHAILLDQRDIGFSLGQANVSHSRQRWHAYDLHVIHGNLNEL